MSERIEATHIVALAMEARRLEGKPGHAEALKLAGDAVDIWKAQFERDRNPEKKCPHCGKNL